MRFVVPTLGDKSSKGLRRVRYPDTCLIYLVSDNWLLPKQTSVHNIVVLLLRGFLFTR